MTHTHKMGNRITLFRLTAEILTLKPIALILSESEPERLGKKF